MVLNSDLSIFKMKGKVHKIESLILIFTGAFLAFSCSTYTNGFLQSSAFYEVQEDPAQMDIDLLVQKKEDLNIESQTILNSINDYYDISQPVRAEDINHLFENLKNQYKIDSCFQYISMFAANDTVKGIARQNLIMAADFYSASFQENKSLRRIINRGNEGFSVKENTHLQSQQFLWKRKIREQNKEQHIKRISSGKTKFDFLYQNRADKLYGAFYKTFGFGSKLLGHLVYKAYLKPRPEKNFNYLIPHLKKWDIVCMKSPNRLTDLFIPGYFGHVGIYLGNNIFAESTQEGVIYSNSTNFAEGNIFVIIRPKTITNKQNKRMLQIVKAQIGKNYDFNFNVESPDMIFCTELIYLVYEQILWKTKRIAGHFTISPDQLVLEALGNNNLVVPFYSKKGQLIKNPDHLIIKQLIQ
jgi:hypothetical protein